MRQQYRDDIDDSPDVYDGAESHHDPADETADETADDPADGPYEPGARLERVQPSTVVGRPASTSAVIVRRTNHQAARMVPWVAGAGTGVTGLAALGAVEAATAAGQPALAGTIVVGAWVATGAGLPALRFRLRDRVRADGCVMERIPRHHRRRWWAAGGLHALWIDAMAAGAVDVVGPWGMAAGLLGGTALLSLRWLREHPVELPTDTPLSAIEPPPPAPALELPPPPVRFPTPPPPDAGNLIEDDWATEVAGGDTPIAPDSELGDDREDLPYGYRWIIQLDRRKGVTITQLRGRVEDIALKLGLDKTHIDIDQLPPGEGRREDRGILTITTIDALKGGVDYMGPRYHDGEIPIGMFQAGGGIPKWRARANTGPLHGMVTGGSGSGKSKLLSLLGMAYKKSREWTIVFTDGDEQGRSAPLLKRIAYDFGKGADDAMAQLEAIEAWFHAAGHTLGEVTDGPDGLPIPITDPDREQVADKLMPCRRYPGWVWIIDEFHRLVTTLGPAFVKRVERLARIIRKVGGAIIIGTQSAEIGDFGGSDVLRAECRSGNVVIMRTKNANDQYAVGDFGCDPTTLPGGGGYAFTDDADEVKQQLRTEYSDDMARWVSTLPDYQPEPYQAMVYAAKRPPKGANPAADYHETQQRKAAVQAAIHAKKPLPWEDQPEQPASGPTTAAAPPIAHAGGDGVAAPVPTAPAGPSRWSAGGIPMAEAVLGPMFTQPAAPAPAAASAESVRPALRAKADRALVVLRSGPDPTTGGPWTTGRVAEEAGMSLPDASKALGVLADIDGTAHRPGGKNGSYAAGRAPVGAAS